MKNYKRPMPYSLEPRHPDEVVDLEKLKEIVSKYTYIISKDEIAIETGELLGRCAFDKHCAGCQFPMNPGNVKERTRSAWDFMLNNQFYVFPFAHDVVSDDRFPNLSFVEVDGMMLLNILAKPSRTSWQTMFNPIELTKL